MELKQFFAQDAAGNVVPNATCHLYIPNTTTYASGLRNASGGALSNPFNGAANGQIQLNSSYTTDGIHLNAAGNAEAALALRPFVKLPFGN